MLLVRAVPTLLLIVNFEPCTHECLRLKKKICSSLK
jgi:hypothetical protein